jgi:hypothetical protein
LAKVADGWGGAYETVKLVEEGNAEDFFAGGGHDAGGEGGWAGGWNVDEALSVLHVRNLLVSEVVGGGDEYVDLKQETDGD